jgi:predicted ester cyclase
LTGRGTHKKQFGPMPPTNKKYEITVIDIMRFKDELLIEHWGVADRLSLIMKILSKLHK